MLNNIFLDFLNRDSRQIYDFYRLPEESHINLLIESINIAVLLCNTHCIVPPGFIAECPLARKALERRLDYLKERAIILPMRETSLEEFFVKKQREYKPFQDLYTGLFNSKTLEAFLNKAPLSITQRKSIIGKEMVTAWEEGIDCDNVIWPILSQELSPKTLDIIRTVPTQIRNDDLAVTWPAINKRIKPFLDVNSNKFRFAVQYHYFNTYLNEFNLKVLSDLPFARDINFCPTSTEYYYSYKLIKRLAESLQIWNLISSISATSMIKIKLEASYFNFRTNYFSISNRIEEISDSFRAIAFAKEGTKDLIRKLTKGLPSCNSQVITPSGIELTQEEIETLAYILDEGTRLTLNYLEEPSKTSRAKVPSYQKTQSNMLNDQVNVLIFTALREERDILKNYWKLENTYPNIFWTTEMTNIKIHVYCSETVGRVPAAISTFEALNQLKPNILILAGIAGGFEEEGIQLGSIIIADQVVDLATRKMHEPSEKDIKPEFRPNVFSIDERLYKFIDSGSFDQNDFINKAREYAEWPDGRIPTIKIGSIASLDDVVASDVWRKNLLEAWPKLLGVEMEAGGVCAAANKHNLKIAVIRGVSDHADPRKSDDSWRKIAMKTVTCFIDEILKSKIFE